MRIAVSAKVVNGMMLFNEELDLNHKRNTCPYRPDLSVDSVIALGPGPGLLLKILGFNAGLCAQVLELFFQL